MSEILRTYWLPLAVILVVVFASYLTFRPENSKTSNVATSQASSEGTVSSRLDYQKVKVAGFTDYQIQEYLKVNPEVKLYNQPAIWPPQPTEKGLKIASFMVVRTSETNKNELKIKYGNGKMSDAELINKVAYNYDADPAFMAYAEAGMQQIISSENRPINNYSQTYSNSSDNSELNNQIQKLKRENNDLDNYKRDFEFNCIISGGVPSGRMCL